ncbi:MAG: peptidoglycan DD-metalloendopeptidase family protein [Pseudomonadota bacterium]
MKQRELTEYKYSRASIAFGAGIFILCAILVYKIWLSFSPEIVIPTESTSITESLELDKDSKLNPEFIINEGDTLASILNEADVSKSEAAAVIGAFSKKFDPRKLNIGTVVSLKFESENILSSMIISISGSKKIEVSRNINNEFTAFDIVIPLIRKMERKITTIKNSFIGSAVELSIPRNSIMSLIRAFSYDIDFQRDIKSGDKLEVVMDKFYTEDGKFSHNGDILYSNITVGNRKISIYKFTHKDGVTDYYNEKGENIKKEFLRTPINAAKITSKFGMRHHPILGYSKMHAGIDFAAPIGTPIIAAGGGVVEVVSHQKGNYGRYIRIKHNSKYSTAYAHASRFAKGIKSGIKVAQGQVIAYVGSTGATTGPHLHYEVLENGKHINPLKFKFSSSSDKLFGKNLEQFKLYKKKIENYLSLNS